MLSFQKTLYTKVGLSLLLFSMFSISSNTAWANDLSSRTAPQGFASESTQIYSIAEVKQLPTDYRFVQVKGALTKYLGENRYVFSDETTSITVYLEHDGDWSQLKKDEVVVLSGKLASKRLEPIIFVKQVSFIEL